MHMPFKHPPLLLLALAASLGLVAACAAGDTGPGRRDGSLDRVDANTPRMDANVMRDGGPDGGPLLIVGICEACAVHEQCGPTARCVPIGAEGDRACMEICNADIPDCPRGFECLIDVARDSLPLCLPIGEACCLDEDADGYGTGIGCMGPDCDDDDIDVHPDAPELCDADDQDCDRTIDEEFVDCPGQRCEGLPAGTYQEHSPSECTGGRCTDVSATGCGLYTCSEGGDSGDVCAEICADGAGADEDDLCIASAHCDAAVCIDDVPNGGTCDEDSDCRSSHCDNGYCCDDGVCCAAVADCPGGGGVGATCDDSATCQGTRGEITCVANQCGTLSGVPDDSACGPTIEANTCGPYRSVFCTGATNQPPPTCPTSCTSHSDCDPSAHCDGRFRICLPDFPDGDLCTVDSDCISAHCNNNVCCSGGDCCRSATDCPASYSTPATCDAPAACQGTRDAATCLSNVCGTQRDVPDDSACTTLVEANTCGLYPSRYCSGGTDQMAPTCAASCTADSECDASAHCDLSACVPDLPDGSVCDEPSDCITGHCQNGFCCATGDCCSTGANCPAATYGEPSVCTSAATCQGTRRDPVCNASHQCTLGGTVDDDSGCAGLVSNDCGLYPSVRCTTAMTQSPDQMGLCATTCASSGDCDSGAFCDSGTMSCTPRGMRGDACTDTAQCNTGLVCEDGVCCGSTCPGTCRACDVPGSLGTCTNIPSGTDPDNECGSVGCSSYYAGFMGDSCYFRADAPASAVDCNGGGACEGAADVCPSQGAGAVNNTCDALCQDPTPGTCAGTLVGACTNVTPTPSTQTCGTGACRVTANRCNAGTPVTCTPGSPGTESCNDVDDDCDAITDEGLSGDSYEPNNSCSGYYNFGNIGTISGGGYSSSVSASATIYGSGDVDVWRVRQIENDDTCGCGFSTDEDYAVRASITVPSGAGSYRICGLDNACDVASTANCVTVAGGASGTIEVWNDGGCPGQDDNDFYFVVRGVGAPAFECAPYSLTLTSIQGCR